ncbi:unnamed protein product [Anisakis simplex]|uniref:G_PROTEIN_RECEP_F1_2 domain-containing protein n=1 Tax=Anisakis simplex TaxID=6269 RepID=A0A0M3K0X2_ANISI|nr:unnamed protein product [Anisakis simplex]
MNLCTSFESWQLFGCLIDVYLLPTVCIFGLVLNIACLIVFAVHNQHPLVPSLIVLSLCDALQLFLSLFVLFLPAVHEYTQAESFSALGQCAYMATGTLSPLLLASNCASIWTMCFIAMRRYEAISRPLHTVASQASNITPLSCIAILALLFNASKWAEFKWFWHYVPNKKRFVLIHESSPLAHNATYRFIREKVLYPVCVYFMPLVVISVVNLRILTILSHERIGNEGRNIASEKRSVLLLTSIVVLFFICHTGGLVIRFYTVDEQHIEQFVLAKDVVNLLFNINSLANPFVRFKIHFEICSQFKTQKDLSIAQCIEILMRYLHF